VIQVSGLGLDCHSCDEHLKRERGCDAEGILPWRIGSETYTRCPKKLITAESWQYLQAFGFYKNGIMPHGKGWRREPQKFLDAMSIIENEVAKIEREAKERNARKR